MNPERFVDSTESKQTVSNTFVTLSFVFLGMIITALLYWSYQKTDTLFIALFSLMVFGYSLMMVIFISIVREKLSVTQFKVFITASIFMAITTLLLFIYFVTRAIQFFKRSGYMQASYQQRTTMVPQQIVRYNAEPYRPPMNPVPYEYPQRSTLL